MTLSVEHNIVRSFSVKAVLLPALLLVAEFYLAYLFMEKNAVDITWQNWRTAFIYGVVSLVLTVYAFIKPRTGDVLRTAVAIPAGWVCATFFYSLYGMSSPDLVLFSYKHINYCLIASTLFLGYIALIRIFERK